MPSNADLSSTNVLLLRTLKCKANIGQEFTNCVNSVFLNDRLYLTYTGGTNKCRTKLLVLDIRTKTQCFLEFVRANNKSKKVKDGFFAPLPFLFSSGYQAGYFRTDDRYFGAYLDLHQRKCHVLKQVTRPAELKGGKIVALFGCPGYFIHRKTSTLCRLTASASDVQVKWTSVQRFQFEYPSYIIRSITPDYLLLLSSTNIYHVQCLRSGRVVELPHFLKWGDVLDIAVIQRGPHLQVLFNVENTRHLELVEVNAGDMVVSERKLLVKLPKHLFYRFYGVHNGSLILSNDRFLSGKMSFYRIALEKPEKLYILAAAQAQKGTKSRYFVRRQLLF